MAAYTWSTLANNQIINWVVGTDTLSFDDGSISAADGRIITWTGSVVTFSVSGKANAALNKVVTVNVAGGGRAFDSAHITFSNGSKLYIGDDSSSVGDGTSTFDDLGQTTLVGGNGNDRFIGLGGNDSLRGGNGNDTFVLNNGANNFGVDTINGEGGVGDWIGVGDHASITGASTISFRDHTVTTAYGSATFSNIENAFGTQWDDVIDGRENTRQYTGNFLDFTRTMEGYAGNDFIRGDNKDGLFDVVRYVSSPNAIVVNLGEEYALDGYDSDSVAGGVQSYTDTLLQVDGVQGSAFNDLLIGGGLSRTADGGLYEDFEGMQGNDTIDGSDGSGSEGARYSSSPSSVNVNLATGVALDGWGGTDTLIQIEVVFGSAFNDTIVGADSNDFFTGNGGADFLDGGNGTVDFINYSGSNAGVNVNLALTTAHDGVDIDFVTAGVQDSIDTFVNIEAVRGSAFNDTLVGNAGDNVLEPLGGNDNLNGGAGFDTARYSRASQAIVASSTGTFAWSVSDGMDADSITGGVQLGTDTLNAIEAIRGSRYADTMTGGAQNESFEGWAGADSINGGAGNNDRADYSGSPDSVTVNLAGGVADDGWGTRDVLSGIESARGSAFNDLLLGTGVQNVLDGAGGADTMNGDAGNDTYFVDNPGDVIVDSAGNGDLVMSTISYTLLYNWGVDTITGGANLEHLTLLGSGAINGNGNKAANTITGNDADNILDGRQANDQLIGGKGNDTYIVAQAGDAVTELANQGTDTVQSSVSIGGVGLYANVENLVLTGASGIDGNGNAIANRITGNAAANDLNGLGGNDTIDGGDGADALDGGAGRDFLYYDTDDTSVDGGSGLRDQLAVRDDGITIDLDTDAAVKLFNLEVFDLGALGANTLDTSLASMHDVVSAGADDFVVIGGFGDVVNVAGGSWQLDGGLFQSGGREYQGYTEVSDPTLRLLVQTSIDLNITMAP